MTLTVADYVLLPGHLYEKVNLILHILYLVLQKRQVLDLSLFSLTPIDTQWDRGLFVEVHPGDFFYCHSPLGFQLTYPIEETERTIQNKKQSTCPFQKEHQTRQLLIDLSERLRIRHAELSNMCYIMAEEINRQCVFCSSRKQVISTIYDACFKEYPFTTYACIELFFEYPIKQDVGTIRDILSVHMHSLNCIFSQVRSEPIRYRILQTIHETLSQLYDKVHEALEQNDDSTLERATQLFKKLLQQHIDDQCPFVRTKKIDFKRWLLSLVYFMQLQHPIPESPSSQPQYITILQKTILLLHLYFNDDRTFSPQTQWYVAPYQSPDKLRPVSLSLQKYDRIHPFLRGQEFASEFATKLI